MWAEQELFECRELKSQILTETSDNVFNSALILGSEV